MEVIAKILTLIKLRLALFFDVTNSPECYKTSLGYNCHHRVYQNGNRECGR